jgi:threonine dehydratase
MTDILRLPTALDVEAARASIVGRARRAPLWRLDADLAGTRIWLKLENLQPLGSFKLRAALHALRCANPEALRRGVGVLAPSAGNFGLGLAHTARAMGVSVTIIAPDGAAKAKTDALEALGAKVIRVPFATWWQTLNSRRFADVEGLFFHPVADASVIAGNATIGAEILEDLPEPDAIVVPFGGGGLISGVGSVMRRLRPATRMIAVESETAQPAAAALRAGGPVTVPYTPSFVDGIGSTTLLSEMWPLVRQVVDQSVSVSLSEIAEAIRLLAFRHRVIAEGAGAAALAAAMAGRAGKGDIVCIVSGGNIDVAKLAVILKGDDAS